MQPESGDTTAQRRAQARANVSMDVRKAITPILQSVHIPVVAPMSPRLEDVMRQIHQVFGPGDHP